MTKRPTLLKRQKKSWRSSIRQLRQPRKRLARILQQLEWVVYLDGFLQLWVVEIVGPHCPSSVVPCHHQRIGAVWSAAQPVSYLVFILDLNGVGLRSPAGAGQLGCESFVRRQGYVLSARRIERFPQSPQHLGSHVREAIFVVFCALA